MIKRILVGLDNTPYTQSALEYARVIAENFQARITGLAVIDTEDIEDHTAGAGIGSIYYAKHLEEKMLADAKEHTLKITADFVKYCKNHNLEFTNIIESGVPFQILKEDSRFNDLMIVGKETHFNFPDKDEPGDTLLKLIKCNTIPILAVKESYEPIRNVLIPVTHSEKTSRMIRFFMQFGLTQTNVFLLHCTDDEKNGELLLHMVIDYIQSFGFKVESYLRKGNPKKEILEFASEKECQMIVMASNEKHRIARFFLGSTTKHILENSDANLLLFD